MFYSFNRLKKKPFKVQKKQIEEIKAEKESKKEETNIKTDEKVTLAAVVE